MKVKLGTERTGLFNSNYLKRAWSTMKRSLWNHIGLWWRRELSLWI